MTEPHVLYALRAKRAETDGYIRDLEYRIKAARASLTHIDATIRMFSAELDPETIPHKRFYRRGGYFSHGELARLCREVLFASDGVALGTADLVQAIMRQKGFSFDDRTLRKLVATRLRPVLRHLEKRRVVVKTGARADARWAFAPDADSGAE